MAQVKIRLNVNKFGYVRQSKPTTVFDLTGESKVILYNSGDLFYFSFASFPSELRRKRLYFTNAKFHVEAGYQASAVFNAFAASDTFTPSSLTYATRPAGAVPGYALSSPDLYSVGGDVLFEPRVATSNEARSIQAKLMALKHTAYMSCSSSEAGEVYFRKLSDGTTVPWVEIAYDDSVDVLSQINAASYPSGNNVDTRSALSFTWDYGPAGEYHCYNESWTQASAKLLWRKSGASAWNEIGVSGSTKKLTVPGNTFPTGSTVQWKLSGTDTLGTTSETSVYSFSTPATQIRAFDYPTGSNIDTRQGLFFSWNFENSLGGYGQSSAALHWRVSTGTTWNTINASGATQYLTVPANTFPTGKTIQWYLTGTDIGGTSSQTSQLSFTTVSTTVRALQYPSGSNVYSGQALLFKWYYNSAVGDYTQKQAVFYWKRDSEQSYRSYSISGNTQQILMAANTFPTNATIQWYIAGTDSGNTTTQTNVASFKTQTTTITVQSGPTGGYNDPRQAIQVSWYFAAAGGPIPAGTATLYWKVTGASTYNQIAASASAQSLTVPANTFPTASTIEWYLAGTDAFGVASQTGLYTFSTSAGTAYAICVYPIGSAVDSAQPITLRWTLDNADGSSPSRVLLQWKLPTESSSSWHTIVNSTSAITSWTAPAYYFPVGEIQWRVQATNRDGTAGPVSAAAFVSLRAPDAPVGLQATSTPLSRISWQADGQQAYEISIDGTVVHKAFGVGVYSWTVPEPLANGVHSIAVRVQGSFGLWSPAASMTVNTVNAVPSGWSDFSISGAFNVDAALTASGAAGAAGRPIQWYRDGKRIAQTGTRTFTDRMVLGNHIYYAEIWNTDGNYVRSSPISGSMKSCVTRIAPLAGGAWQELKLSEKSDSVQNFSYKRTTSLRHVLGARYPVLETAEFEDESGSYDCAFRDVGSAAAFEALRGQVVILKSRGGSVVTGALADLNKSYKDFYITYSFTIRRIAWEDFIDGTA